MNPVYVTVSMAMTDLREENRAAFDAAVAHAHGQPLSAEALPALEALAIVECGVMHDLTAEAIRWLCSVEAF